MAFNALLAKRRLAVGVAAVAILIAVVVASSGGGSTPRLPAPAAGQIQRAGDPFAYSAAREPEFVARATAGSSHVLFVKSPGGVMASAARVAALRRLVAAAAGSSVDPNILEALVFVESAGRSQVIAGSDPAAAAGLTQILAQTGQVLLGMHIDLGRSRRLTAAINRASAAGNRAAVSRLERQRAKIDDRFNPAKALAATIRYLELAQRRFGRSDLAVVSYHMGVGNLAKVLDEYDSGRTVPYAQLYFDSAPDRHPAAYNLLSGFGDQSSLYYWRVLGAAQIMHLYRTDRGELARLSALHAMSASAADVLHPPDQTSVLADPEALARAYASGSVVPLPSNASGLGLAYDPGMGALAHKLGKTPALYRGLAPAALGLLVELAHRVRALSGGAAPLVVTSAVTDGHYQQLLGFSDAPAAAGYSFTLARRYVRHAQAVALQSLLDRLQALNLIAWVRFPATIEVTVASDAAQVIARGV
jgi:hypothetical protein